MVDMGSIAAAISSIKVAGDIAKGLVGLHTSTEVTAKTAELNQALLDAQHRMFEANAAYATITERVRNLEGQLRDLKNWDAEKQRYDLKQPHTGCLVYALQKASMKAGEPAHYICAACYEDAQRSILQLSIMENALTAWLCGRCKAVARTGYRGQDKPRYAEEIS